MPARYEKLDDVGRGAVNAIMKYEESRMAEELQKVSRLDAETGAMLDMIGLHRSIGCRHPSLC